MKAKVIDSICIGCGACCAISDEFEFNDEGIAYVKDEIIKEENEEIVKEAKDNCPVGAITISEEDNN